jgi:fructosamine-3-kinase
VSTSAQTVASAPSQVAVSPEIETVLHLMFAPGVAFLARTAGRKTIVESDAGKGNERLFAMLPNERSPRWLLPLQRHGCTRRALEQIRVFAPGAMAAKAILRVAAAVGALPRVTKTLSVSGASGLSLFDEVAQMTGHPDASFAVTFGTPSGYRKLTVSVMRPDGILVAFVKVPMTQEAMTRIGHEAEMLNALSRTALSNRVPRVLFHGEWNGQTALCISAGPAEASPMQFGVRHRALLEALWSIRPAVRDAEALVTEVAEEIRTLGAAFDPGSTGIVSAAIGRARQELQDAKIVCGLSHGDFAPWNLHTAKDALFVFDWEAAAWDRPNLWDIAHFDTQLVTLLGHKSRFREITRGMLSAQGLYLLYLVKTIADASRESGASSTQVSDRVRLLRNALQN